MKKQIFALSVILLITLGMTSCGSKSSTQQTESPTTEQMAVDTSLTPDESLAVVYQCPMKCEGEKTYDKPGKCPKCKMDLKDKDEHEGHNY